MEDPYSDVEEIESDDCAEVQILQESKPSTEDLKNDFKEKAQKTLEEVKSLDGNIGMTSEPLKQLQELLKSMIGDLSKEKS